MEHIFTVNEEKSGTMIKRSEEDTAIEIHESLRHLDGETLVSVLNLIDCNQFSYFVDNCTYSFKMTEIQDWASSNELIISKDNDVPEAPFYFCFQNECSDVSFSTRNEALTSAFGQYKLVEILTGED